MVKPQAMDWLWPMTTPGTPEKVYPETSIGQASPTSRQCRPIWYQMPGMLTPDEMTRLAEAHGPAFDRLFLEGMIKHHQGAVAMAEDEVANGQNPQAKQLAQDIVTSQQAEIETMTTLLAGL